MEFFGIAFLQEFQMNNVEPSAQREKCIGIDVGRKFKKRYKDILYI